MTRFVINALRNLRCILTIVRSMHGFTIIELLISIAIFAIIVANGFTKLPKMFRQNITSYCRELNTTLDNLYLESLLTNNEAEITFDDDINKIIVNKTNAGTNKIKISNPPKHIHISSAKFSGLKPKAIIFKKSSSGTTSANNGTTILQDEEGKTCSIIQSLYGARRYEVK